MSLFTLTDLWSYDCHEPNPHTFCHKSVVIGNVDNEEAFEGSTAGDLTKVVLANYSGLLRIIGTSCVEASTSTNPNNLQGTLLAELHLGAPILQIEAGYFLGIADKLDLAILHPHRLGIYTVTKLPGQIEHGSQYKITLLYEHALKRHAFNMCYGRFGSPSASTGLRNPTPVSVAPPLVVASRRGRKTSKMGVAGIVEDALEETKRVMRHGVISTTDGSGGGSSASSSQSLTKRKDFICVQSLDGTLSFFEQEVYTFSCYLPNFLLPGPLAYVQESDCFVTTSSGWELQCFKYANLVAMAGTASAGTGSNTGTEGADAGAAPTPGTSKQTQETSVGKRLVAEWSYSLGEESICDIQVLTTKGHPSAASSKSSTTSTSMQIASTGGAGARARTRLILATFRHLYCFDLAGDVLWCKRLDFQMSSFTSYLNSSNEVITLATSVGNVGGSGMGDTGTEVASAGPELGTLYIFNGTALKWAAKLPFNVVYVGRIPINDIPGGVALLSSQGHLAVQCLGTEPSLFVAPTVESRELDYEAAEKELAGLRKIINAAGEQDVATPKDNTVEVKVEFEGQNTRWLEPEPDGMGMGASLGEREGQQIVALVATVKLVARIRVNDVRVTVSTASPIVCTHESVHVGDIVGRHNFTVEFHTSSDAIPADLACTLSVFYTNDTGVPYLIQKTGIRIPLFIVARPASVVDKSGTAKLTFGVNKPVLNLTSFYNDFEWGPESTAAGAPPPTNLTFQFCGGETVTILVSTKTATGPEAGNVSRYRIQSNSIAAIHLVFHDFVERLGRKFGRQANSDLEITISEPGGELPLLEEYFNEIEEHLVRRRREVQIREDITDRASQLRAVQRRLLVRFRDKNVAPLTQLETLLDGSLDQFMDALQIMDQNELEKRRTECRLSGATKLMLEIAQIQGRRKLEDVVQLSSAFCPPAVPNFAQDAGWEEAVFTNLSYLKTNQVASCPSLGQLDVSKLKKVIKTTLDKLRQSSTPVPSSATGVRQRETGGSDRQQPSEPVLIGNEIVERMASARGKTARRRTAAAARSLDSIPEPEHDAADAENEQQSKNTINEKQKQQKVSTKKSAAVVGEGEIENHNHNHMIGSATNSNNNNMNDDDFW